MKLLTTTGVLALLTLIGYFGLLFTGTEVPDLVEWLVAGLVGGTIGVGAEKWEPAPKP